MVKEGNQILAEEGYEVRMKKYCLFVKMEYYGTNAFIAVVKNKVNVLVPYNPEDESSELSFLKMKKVTFYKVYILTKIEAYPIKLNR